MMLNKFLDPAILMVFIKNVNGTIEHNNMSAQKYGSRQNHQ